MINFRLSFRSVLRGRVYLFLNLTGLSIAFAISFFILSYIIREYSYDRNFENYERIARVLTVKKTFGWTEPSASYPLYSKISTEIPGVVASTITRRFRSYQVIKGEDILRIRSAYAITNDYFKIFTPDIIIGNPDQFLEDPGSVVITRSVAEKIFGKIPVIGAGIEVMLGADILNMTIGGVIEDIPQTSSFRPELIASFDLMKYEFPEGSYFAHYIDSWQMDNFRMFVLLDHNSEIFDIAGKINDLSSELPDQYDYDFSLQPLSKVHLFSTGFANDGNRGDIRFVLLFGSVGLLILIIAISNYIIISIGSSSRRIPEIATRKIFGAGSKTVGWYIIFESLLICMLSIPVAYLIASFSSETVKELFNISLDTGKERKYILIITSIIVILITGISSGIYLAGKLSRTSPLAALGSINGYGRGKILYKVLITMQIVIFVTLLSAAFIVLKQLNYSKNIDPGFDSSNLIIGEFQSGMVSDYNALRYELLKNPDIENITFGSVLPPTQSSMVSVMQPPDGGEEIRFEGVSTDFHFISTAGIEIIAGRNFDENIPSDSTARIINETMANKLGLDENNYGSFERFPNIIGIARNFQIHSIREEIPSISIGITRPRYINSFLARCRQGSEEDVIIYIEQILNTYKRDYLSVLSYDEAVSNMYGKEARFGTIVIVFGIIALLVAMLGVFGLSLFLTNEMKFDTAIYRVYGASSRKIINNNMRRYFIYIGLGNIISIPLVVIIMSKWLQQFAERITIGPLIFVASFLISAIVFISTTMLNTLRLANLNPVDNLRQE